MFSKESDLKLSTLIPSAWWQQQSAIPYPELVVSSMILLPQLFKKKKRALFKLFTSGDLSQLIESANTA